MDGFVVHEIAADVVVRVTRPMPDLSPALDQAVERLWRAACQRVSSGGAGQLFNGRVFSADRITRSEITGHMTEFRRIVAQMDDPSLAPTLELRPLAVCGVLRCAGSGVLRCAGSDVLTCAGSGLLRSAGGGVLHSAGGVVIGRRPSAAVYQPGMWQLPPAGSVDANALRPDNRIDLAGQILAELHEELGLSPIDVSAPVPLCIVEHPGSRVADLGLAMTTHLDADTIRATHQASGNTEYDPLLVVPDAELAAFVASAGADLVPPAREFLARIGLLPYGLSPPAGP